MTEGAENAAVGADKATGGPWKTAASGVHATRRITLSAKMK